MTLKFCSGLSMKQTVMPVALDRGEALCIIRLEGGISIAAAAEIKAILLQALASGTEIRLDLERATELGITTLQLLWAAEHQARRSGMEFTLVGSARRSLARGK